MSFNRLVWEDRRVEFPNRFKITNNPDGTVDLEERPGIVENEGTPITAGHMNRIEEGIEAQEAALDTHKADYVRQPAYAVTSGTSTAYTVTLDPAPTGIIEGFAITIVPHVACGANPTLNVNGKGAIQLRNSDNEQLGAGDLLAGVPYNFRKVGANFIASSGKGVKINGALDMVATFAEVINKGDTIKAAGIELGGYSGLFDFSDVPSTIGYDVALSHDSVYMAVAHYASPYVTIHKRSGDTFTRLSNPSTLPSGVGRGVAFSPDDVYMAVAHQLSPYISIYKRSGDTFTKLPNPSGLPSGNAYSVAFSPDGVYMAVAHQASPYISIYKRSGDTFTKLPNPSDLPAGNAVGGVAFSPDGLYVAITTNASPYVTIYKRDGDTFAKLPNPNVLPAGMGNGVAFSPDGVYMAVAHQASPYISIYKRSGDTFTKLPNPSDLASNHANSVVFSPDGLYMVGGHLWAPHVIIYKRSGDAFTKLPNPSTLPPSEVLGVDFSYGGYLAVAQNGLPYANVYKTALEAYLANNSVNGLSELGGAGYALESGTAGQQKKVSILFRKEV